MTSLHNAAKANSNANNDIHKINNFPLWYEELDQNGNIK